MLFFVRFSFIFTAGTRFILKKWRTLSTVVILEKSGKCLHFVLLDLLQFWIAYSHNNTRLDSCYHCVFGTVNTERLQVYC